jgi:hypothetical protein
MYMSLFESYVLWMESRGTSSTNAVFRAGVAFSLYALISLTSATLLLNMFAGIPLESWIDDHRWSIWAATALVAASHWYIARSVAKRHKETKPSSDTIVPPRFMWAWYFIPVIAIFVAAVALALTRTT